MSRVDKSKHFLRDMNQTMQSTATVNGGKNE